ncbi:hypothetical protein [Actinacidiphila sp. ITFR-21]|uniref:hypothetical protein n=1 Tax=Actinacidiphila sp. ITFR-21 TaxID=3075199 RepID=UPI002889C9D6|nr:hypothetical protein [Streptomyces sp. ITFR-21]WNI15522.1 hypothetical protein RLT57_08285 [Streptomyces sp. ITFR-21]
MTYTPTQGVRPTVPARRGPAPRRRAWAEGADRLRTALTTEPGRLRLIGAVLTVLVVAFGAVTAWQITERAAAADRVVHRSSQVSRNAADIYRYLADADATVSEGFLGTGQEPAEDTARYQKDITSAARLITTAAASSAGSSEAAEQIVFLSTRLPAYAQLVATAQADDRQGFPLGAAYLRYADSQMQTRGGLLDSAAALYRIENDRLSRDYADAKALPWAAWVLGALVLTGLVWAQRRNYRRTNRVFNQGMLAASLACAMALVWLVAGHTLARTRLSDSYVHGARSVQALNNARITVLQARSDENLTLVARGSGQKYEDGFGAEMKKLTADDPRDPGAQLAYALALADSAAGRDPVRAAIKKVRGWGAQHDSSRASDKAGEYDRAVAQVIGTDCDGRKVADPAEECFRMVGSDLDAALAQEQSEFARAADSGHGALSLLPVGVALLALLAAAGTAIGIGRRLSEYR